MKRMAFAVGVVVLVFGVGILTKAQTQSVEQELIKLEKEWPNANVKANLAFLDRVMAEDYTWTDFEGVVWDKAQSLAVLKSGDDIISSMENDDLKVRVYGDAAVVTGRFTTKETLKDKDISGQYRFTDTWIKKAGRWQCVAGQGSKIPQK